MSSTASHQPINSHPAGKPGRAGFGRRVEPAVVTLRRNGQERSLTLNPLITGSIAGIVCLVMVAVITASAYLALRDDIVGATLSRHARMQHAYEDRITALRSQVDLVTSRQLLDQQAVESRVEALLARQAELGARQQQFRKAISKATKNKTIGKSKKKAKPLTTGSIRSNQKLRLGALVGSTTPFNSKTAQPTRFAAFSPSDAAMFDTLEEALAETEREQLAELQRLKKLADSKSIRLAKILSKQGIRVPADTAVGGPLIELDSASQFDTTVNALEASLATLEKMRITAKSLPHGSPAPNSQISSHFGTRKDPFTGRRAVHGGLDFRARTGTPVRATGSGTVIKAGRLGGYGKLVEIDHGGGITTRYAHLSRIKVRKGQKIKRGNIIGKVGSTGRSTGPHLHYEVRRKDRVQNPINYVRLEKRLKPFL